jgi:hypothetical protein
MYKQEPLMTDIRGYLQRDLNEKAVSSRKRNWVTDAGSRAGERYEWGGVQCSQKNKGVIYGEKLRLFSVVRKWFLFAEVEKSRL